MAKAVAKKKLTKKPAKKMVRRSGSRVKTKEGDRYACEVCGLAITVDETCGCVDSCDLICCETPMTKKRARA